MTKEMPPWSVEVSLQRRLLLPPLPDTNERPLYYVDRARRQFYFMIPFLLFVVTYGDKAEDTA